MRRATIQDLKLELWLRQRNSNNIYWTTRSGDHVAIKNMDINHLLNTIKMLLKQEKNDNMMIEHIRDMDPMDYYD